ncbi:site-specific DNA-methyltransferase [Microbacterium rhizomatis]|uniref:Site-specific DNA-methyltransferase n=1 Tax=Microbacterium rhizomatis TaxID=1631477 RepID=A0A5J5J2H6_9MICO|nr:site-specific DNA-methyltransferase [Microbacterium rhizomatis]
MPDAEFTLIYLDPPFNTGRVQHRAVETARSTTQVGAPGRTTQDRSTDSGAPGPDSADIGPVVLRCAPGAEPGPGVEAADPGAEPGPGVEAAEPGAEPGPGSEPGVQARPGAASSRSAGAAPVVRTGFHGREYERLSGDLRSYDDRFDDYWAFLEPRLVEAWRLLADDGTLYVHLDYREAHYAKVLMDALFGRDRFLNELIWAYDYGAKTRKRWPTKHDTILVYVKDPSAYWFDSEAVDREPYMAPGLVTPEKAARGKLPTDVWWHTIVPTTGREKTGYPTQKPEGILRRIIQASSRPGDSVLDFFAGSGTTGAVASALGRHAVLVDENPAAIEVMRRRMPHARLMP